MALTIEQNTMAGGVPVLSLRGRLDSETAGIFDEAASGLGSAEQIVLDLSQLEYVSSAGLRSVFTLSRELAVRRARLFLCGLQPAVRKVFEMVRIIEADAILDNLESVANKLGS